MPEERQALAARTTSGDITGLEKRNWQAILFVVLTTMLLALTVLVLLFPGVLDYLQHLRAEGDLDRYAGLLVLVIMLYCVYVLRMQAQFSRMRQRMVNEQVNLRSLEQLVAQVKYLTQVASTVHLRQQLEETLRVLVATAQESLGARGVGVVVERAEDPPLVVSAGKTLLTEAQATMLAGRLRDSSEPLKLDRPSELASLLGSVPAEMGALLAMPLSHPRGYLGVLFAEFSPATRSGPGRGAELDLLRIFAENTVIAAENDSLVRQIERMAITDELTGLYNRRYFNQELEREVVRSDRTGRPFGLLILDIDHFKQINDTYGHQAGDQALRRVAGALESCSRKSNLLARFGGEEFVTVLLDTTGEGALIAAERMRQAVEDIADLPHRITISVGAAVYPLHSRNIEGLLKSADSALYAAKHAGRNHVCAAEAVSPAAG